MNIEWNKVTWYSKLLAVIVFVGTFALAFWLGSTTQIQFSPKPVNEPVEFVQEIKKVQRPTISPWSRNQTEDQEMLKKIDEYFYDMYGSAYLKDWRVYKNDSEFEPELLSVIYERMRDDGHGSWVEYYQRSYQCY